jgi:2,4-dienoyl-CoA reductase-like NADH-dependent reductase (Old Yellow Enzyme family)
LSMSTIQQVEPLTQAETTALSTSLFSPLTIRGITLPNRIAVSPMCQYVATNGFANDWHLVHLGSRAVGGAGLIIVEATAVEARGRITPGDLGLWEDAQIEPLARIVRFLKSQGSVPGIQLAHAGRKASSRVPWEGGEPLTQAEGAWPIVAPSAIPFSPEHPTPHALTKAAIAELINAFAASASRALEAGFEVVEIHGAHGYLMNSFLSPLSNHRTDEYGGSFENRIRFTLEVVEAVRQVWPRNLPLFLRISASDWAEGGWTVDDSIELARRVKRLGVDLIDCSSGGLVPYAKIPVQPGYQVPFADRVRNEAGILTAAVGLITEAEQAQQIVAEGQADVVLLAREMLREPYWALEAAYELGVNPSIPNPYLRAFKR